METLRKRVMLLLSNNSPWTNYDQIWIIFGYFKFAIWLVSFQNLICQWIYLLSIYYPCYLLIQGEHQRSKYYPFEINLPIYPFGVQKLSIRSWSSYVEGKYQRSKYNPFEINLPYYPLAAKTIHNIMVILEGKCQRSKYNPFVIHLPYYPFGV